MSLTLGPIRRPDDHSPWLFPIRLAADEATVELVELTPDIFAGSVFHDASLGDLPVARRLAFEQLASFAERQLTELPSARYIFHHAFCCSTLLSRLLGHPGLVFEYREPAALTELARIHLADSAFLRNADGQQLIRSVARLLRRTEYIGQLPLVKACDAVTGVMQPLMQLEPDASVILLHSDLEPFVLACVKSDRRREWASSRAQLVESWATPELADVSAVELSAGEAAAYVWAAHMRAFARIRAQFPGRVRTLAAETLLANPVETTCAAATFFGLPADYIREHAETVLARAVHAKTGIPFDVGARRAEHDDVRARMADEVARAIAWCERRRLPIDGAGFFRS